MVTAGSELVPGVSIDHRYRIQCTLGRGGFGRTYLAADDCRFGDLCVLKEFVPSNETDPVIAQKLWELFQREAMVLHQLNHPQIPKFLAVFKENDRLFIAQEYINGKTYWRLLQERQSQGRAFSQREILPWLRSLLHVLAYLHENNIVHRDISPDNIMLPKGSQDPILIDFGVVKQVFPHLHNAQTGDPTDLIQASVSVGKFGYAPSEQIRMGQCSPRSDLYALAVTAVVLLTGKPPNLLIDEKSLEWKWQQLVRLDARLRQILEVMMAEKPQDRYPSAITVVEALQAIDEASLPMDLQPEPPVKFVGEETAMQLAAPLQSAMGTVLERSPDLLTATTGLKSDDVAVKPWEAAGLTVAMQRNDRKPNLTTAYTAVSALLAPRPSSQLVWTAAQPLPSHFSLQSWFSFLKAGLLQLPRDRQGNSKQFTLKQLISLSILVLLPLGGIAVGIRSPYIASICWILENCADGQNQGQRYHQVVEIAEAANALSTQARNLSDLQQARHHLAYSIAQLTAFSGPLKISAANILPKYQDLLDQLDRALEKETRSAQLLSRAEAEAQKAIEQSRIAKTAQQYREAQLQWKRVMATLAAIPKETLVDRQVAARLREYQTRLDAVSVKVAATTPKNTQTTDSTPLLQPAELVQSVAQADLSQATAGVAQPSTARQAAAQSTSSRSRSSQTASSKSAAQRSNARSRTTSTSQPRRSTRAAQTPPARPAAPASPPSTSPLEIARRWMAGSVVTSATQTLDNVAIWLEGSRTESDGTFTANLMIQNRSGRGFGFIPLYAESKNSEGVTVRSRVLFTGTSDTMLEPGELLSGKVSLLDRPANSRSLTLVIQESTSGDRTFRVPF